MSAARKKFLQLLEADDSAAIQAVWEHLTEKRTETVWVDVTERQVELRADGTTGKVVKERRVKVPVEIERYPIKDFLAFASLAAQYGVGKPPEEKKVDVVVRQGLPAHELTMEELRALADEQPALPRGS